MPAQTAPQITMMANKPNSTPRAPGCCCTRSRRAFIMARTNMQFRHSLLCSAIRAFVLKFKQSVIGLDYSLRSHGQVTGGAQRAFNKATYFFYEICKLRLILIRRGQREPSRVTVPPKSTVPRILCLRRALFGLKGVLIARFTLVERQICLCEGFCHRALSALSGGSATVSQPPTPGQCRCRWWSKH